MNRREFIAGLGGSAARPVVVRAQQGERARRIGVLTGPGAGQGVLQAEQRYAVRADIASPEPARPSNI
jgi:hypothetical protein